MGCSDGSRDVSASSLAHRNELKPFFPPDAEIADQVAPALGLRSYPLAEGVKTSANWVRNRGRQLVAHRGVLTMACSAPSSLLMSSGVVPLVAAMPNQMLPWNAGRPASAATERGVDRPQRTGGAFRCDVQRDHLPRRLSNWICHAIRSSPQVR